MNIPPTKSKKLGLHIFTKLTIHCWSTGGYLQEDVWGSCYKTDEGHGNILCKVSWSFPYIKTFSKQEETVF